MKHSLVVISLFISSLSFAGTIGNGITLSNLPKASKSYSKSVFSEADVPATKESVIASCKKDKAEAEAIVVKLGSKILSSEGCMASVRGGYVDQGGSFDYEVTAQFEVIFK